MTLRPEALPPLLDDPPLQRLLLDPHGRIGRRQFWLVGVLGLLLAATLLHALLGIAGVGVGTTEGLVNLLLLWPALVLTAKRCHDRDISGWWALLLLLPVIGWLWALVFNGFLRGTPGANRFGPPPAQ